MQLKVLNKGESYPRIFVKCLAYKSSYDMNENSIVRTGNCPHV